MNTQLSLYLLFIFILHSHFSVYMSYKSPTRQFFLFIFSQSHHKVHFLQYVFAYFPRLNYRFNVSELSESNFAYLYSFYYSLI